MPVSLHEDDVGHDCEIWYPDLWSCMGYTLVLDDGTLLGAHLTIATRYKQFLDISAYFDAQRGAANILSVLLIGNFNSWRTKAESMLRAGGNLQATVRASLREYRGVIYKYDSVFADAGGLGAAAHLTHRGNEFPYPYVELYKEDAWSNVVWLNINDPVAENPEIRHSYGPGPGELELGKRHGLHTPAEVNLVKACGDKTEIEEAEMERM